MACPVCDDGGGRAPEGKETRHSVKELDLLDGNNSHGSKTRMKIATDHSGILEANSSTIGCFLFILGSTKQTWSPGSVGYLSLIPFIVRVLKVLLDRYSTETSSSNFPSEMNTLDLAHLFIFMN